MRVLKPDFLLVLIWPFRKEVINQEVSFIKSGGSLIFLLPKFHIVDKMNYKKYLKASFKPLSYSYHLNFQQDLLLSNLNFYVFFY